MTVSAGIYPVGEIFLDIDGGALRGVRLDSRFAGKTAETGAEKLSAPDKTIYCNAKRWLDAYFEGEILPLSGLNIRLKGTEFRMRVWRELGLIRPGRTVSYGDIAKNIEKSTGRRVSARAVGGAVGKNPLPILLPCHRVIGSNGALTGYTGGLDKKIFLLRREGFTVENGKVK